MFNDAVPAPKPVSEKKVKKEKVVEPKVPAYVFGADQKDQEVLGEIRTLSANLEMNNLEIGWKIAEYWQLVKPDAVSAFGSERKALTETINFVTADSGQKRSTIADRLRIGAVISHDTYNAIVEECGKSQPENWKGPTFWQIRSCVVTENGQASVDETNKRINWCVENNWPSAREIQNEFAPAGKVKIDPADRAWNIMVKQAQRVVELTGVENPRNKAAKAVMTLWASESGVPAKL
jgi:hypothetical protein